MASEDHGALMSALKAAPKGSLAWLRCILDVTWYELTAGAFKRGFAHVSPNVVAARALLVASPDCGETQQTVAEFLQLAGSEMYLRCCHGKAMAYYEEVLAIMPRHFEACIRLADCLTETGSITKAEAIFAQLTTTYVDGDSEGCADMDISGVFPTSQQELDTLSPQRRRELLKVWVLCHRITLQKFRTEAGTWRDDAISGALATITDILALTGQCQCISFFARPLHIFLIRCMYFEVQVCVYIYRRHQPLPLPVFAVPFPGVFVISLSRWYKDGHFVCTARATL